MRGDAINPGLFGAEGGSSVVVLRTAVLLCGKGACRLVDGPGLSNSQGPPNMTWEMRIWTGCLRPDMRVLHSGMRR